MLRTVLRLPEHIAKALKKEAKTKLSINSLIIEILAKRYDLPFEDTESRDHEKYFKKGELHGFILGLLRNDYPTLSTSQIVDLVIEAKEFKNEDGDIRKSIRGVVLSMQRKGVIVKVGSIGRAHLWRVNE